MKKSQFYLILFLIVIVVSPAFSGVSISDVKYGFDGLYKLNSWVPVTTTIENDQKNMEGTLSIVVESSYGEKVFYSKHVNLPKNSKQRFTLYPFQTGYTYSAPDVVLELDAKVLVGKVKTKTITSPVENIKNITENDNLIVVIGNDDDGLAAASGSFFSGNVSVVNLSEEFLPDRLYGYDGVDLLVMGEVQLSILSQEQKSAITNWVLSGGRLMVSTGQYGQIYKESFLESLLPVKINNLKSTPFPHALTTFFDADAPLMENNELLISDSQLTSGRIILTEQDSPILVEGSYGAGEVIFCAFDVSSKIFRSWTGNRNFLRYFLDGKRDKNYNSWLSQYYNNIYTWLSNNPAVTMPSFAIVFLFIIGYVVVVGPVNYLFLKKKKRLELAWVTIPIIVVIFSFIALGIGYAKKGTSLLMRNISVVETSTGTDRAFAKTYFSVFSPKKANYTLRTKNEDSFYSTFQEGNAYSYRKEEKNNNLILVQDDDSYLTNLSMNMWTMKTLRNTSICDLGQGFDGEIIVSNGGVSGQIINGTPYTFDMAYLMCFNRLIALNNFEPGVKQLDYVMSDFNLSTSLTYNYTGTDEDRRKVLELISSKLQIFTYEIPYSDARSLDKAMLIGISDDTVTEVNLDNNLERRKTASLFFVDLPIKFQGENVNLSSFIDGKIIEYDKGDAYNHADNILRLKNGSLITEFVLPQVPHQTYDTNIQLQNYQNLELYLYDWNGRNWITMPTNRQMNIFNPDICFYSGRMRVKVASPNSSYPVDISQFKLNANGDF